VDNPPAYSQATETTSSGSSPSRVVSLSRTRQGVVPFSAPVNGLEMCTKRDSIRGGFKYYHRERTSTQIPDRFLVTRSPCSPGTCAGSCTNVPRGSGGKEAPLRPSLLKEEGTPHCCVNLSSWHHTCNAPGCRRVGSPYRCDYSLEVARR
jgi:hypothetical protein